MMDWKPIETAPKDGTWVAVKSGRAVPDVAFWNVALGGWQNLNNYLSTKGFALGYDEWPLTHWMPLPEPPK